MNFSSHGIVRYRSSGLLLREFLHRMLYDNKSGFFASLPLLEGPVQDFGSFRSLDEYRSSIKTIMKSRGGKFVTPSELFRPWYGRAIANWALSEHQNNKRPLLVYEIGAGNASTAEDFLLYLRQNYPEVYRNTKYTVIELSYAMAEQQKNRLAGFIDEGVADVQNRNVIDWDEVVEEKCCVIGLEVLDNMPHDRVVVEGKQVWQTQVAAYLSVKKLEQPYYYELTRLEDELILRTGYFWQPKKGWRDPDSRLSLKNVVHTTIDWARWILPFGVGYIFVPTTGQQFLEVLASRFPRHRVLLSDFNFLLRTVPGENGALRSFTGDQIRVWDPQKCNRALESRPRGPLAQSYKPERIHACLLEASRYESDVIFPTNFSSLTNAYELISERSSRVQTHPQFLTEYGHIKETQLQDGSNPMLTHYSNVRYLTSSFKDLPQKSVHVVAGPQIEPENPPPKLKQKTPN